jgi:hypothetical protein
VSPFPPSPHAPSWVIKLHTNGIVENTFKSIIDKEPIYAIKSMQHAGGQIDGRIVSAFSSLLPDWTRLKELRLINRSSVIMRACPSLIVERQPLTAYTTQNETSMRQTADTLFRMGKTLSYPVLNQLEFKRPKDADFDKIVKTVETGKAFDIKDSVLTLPAGYTISTQPKTEAVDIELHEQKFTATVLSAMMIPPSFFNSAKTGTGISSSQKTEQSENDRHMLMTSINTTVRDIGHFYRRVYDIIADVDVDVVLPSTLPGVRALTHPQPSRSARSRSSGTSTRSTSSARRRRASTRRGTRAYTRTTSSRTRATSSRNRCAAPCPRLTHPQVEWVPPQKKTKS